MFEALYSCFFELTNAMEVPNLGPALEKRGDSRRRPKKQVNIQEYMNGINENANSKNTNDKLS